MATREMTDIMERRLLETATRRAIDYTVYEATPIEYVKVQTDHCVYHRYAPDGWDADDGYGHMDALSPHTCALLEPAYQAYLKRKED